MNGRQGRCGVDSGCPYRAARAASCGCMLCSGSSVAAVRSDNVACLQLVIWDNRAVLHRGLHYDVHSVPRVMRRVRLERCTLTAGCYVP